MSNPYSLVALLPMKAHSERIAGKNFRTFAGRPLFQWILDTLLQIDAVEKVIINTDAREILASHGLTDNDRVLIRDRADAICGGDVSMNRVLEDDLRAIDASTYLMTHTTNPLLSPQTLRRGIEAFRENRERGEADSLFSVSRFQSRFYDAHGKAVNHDPAKLLRTQDLPPLYEENSNLYLFSRASFETTDARIGSRPMLFETPFMESFDIDDADGWDLAELVAKSRLQSGVTPVEQSSS
ncbi:MAG: acylneuraminate cytidylyltransferase family protein [Planctomycetota bacterium]